MKRYNNLFCYGLILLFIGFGFMSCSDDENDDKVVNISLNSDQLVNEGDRKVITLKDNATLQLNVHIMPSSAFNKNVTYSTVNSTIVTISDKGLVTPLAIGRDTITIRATDGSDAYVTYPINIITHIVKVNSITLSGVAQKVVLEKGNTFDLSEQYKINPVDATEKSVTFTSSDETVVTVDKNGLVTSVNEGEAIVTITATDGSEKQVQSKITVVKKITGPVDYDRKGWGITVSHELPPENGNNRGECILDGDNSSFLSMIKPGHEMDGISVGAGEDVYFVIDMKKEQEVDYFRYVHRNSVTVLRFLAVSLYGSNDGETFTPIAEKVEIPNAEVGAIVDPGNVTVKKTKYRYYKVSFTRWLDGTPPGQINEFFLGYIKE